MLAPSPSMKVPGRQLPGSPRAADARWETRACVCAASATCSSSCQSLGSSSLKYQRSCTETGSDGTWRKTTQKSFSAWEPRFAGSTWTLSRP